MQKLICPDCHKTRGVEVELKRMLAPQKDYRYPGEMPVLGTYHTPRYLCPKCGTVIVLKNTWMIRFRVDSANSKETQMTRPASKRPKQYYVMLLNGALQTADGQPRSEEQWDFLYTQFLHSCARSGLGFGGGYKLADKAPVRKRSRGKR
jgi:hypothetical protein